MSSLSPILLLVAALPLGGCSPGSNAPPADASSPSPVAATTAPRAAPPPAAASSAALGEAPTASAPEPRAARASIRGAIRDGNRPPPALRICAHPVAGGLPACIDSPAGAIDYRIEVEPGRYHLMGWVQGGELALLAHASQIRCIQAPCPPDELIEVEVAAGEEEDGIDLSGAYVDLPTGWPARPA